MNLLLGSSSSSSAACCESSNSKDSAQHKGRKCLEMSNLFCFSLIAAAREKISLGLKTSFFWSARRIFRRIFGKDPNEIFLSQKRRCWRHTRHRTFFGGSPRSLFFNSILQQLLRTKSSQLKLESQYVDRTIHRHHVHQKHHSLRPSSALRGWRERPWNQKPCRMPRPRFESNHQRSHH